MRMPLPCPTVDGPARTGAGADAPHYCPFCERWRSFLAHGVEVDELADAGLVGGGRREHVRCPGCGSTDRERLLYLYLRETTGFRLIGSTVLHVAPERRLTKLLYHATGGRYLTADIKPGCTIRLDVSRMPLRSETFDLVICNHVLEHVADDHAAMREIARVLVPGGRAVVQVPLAMARARSDEAPELRDPQVRLRRFGQRDHVRLYGRDYPERLTRAGFDVETVPCTVLASERAIDAYRLNRHETMHIAWRRS